MQLALECVRREVDARHTRNGRANIQIHAAISCLVKGDMVAPDVAEVLNETLASQARQVRARLALYLRAMLRADRGDFGIERVSTLIDPDTATPAEIVALLRARHRWSRRITPLWERARPHGDAP